MNRIQEKLLEYPPWPFMAGGLLIFLAGFMVQITTQPDFLTWYQVLTVLGALVLGYGTGRCDAGAS
ncbi:MAG: hypothetical protein ABEK01_00660 [Candidatus Nanohaloarchaea archaeon]